MTDLSVLIPARNEMFLSKTIQDIIEHAESDYEIIAVLDGAWADPPIPTHPRVTILHYPDSIGQRAATNAAARIASGKYLAKVDAHCSFDQGFDVKMLVDMQPDWAMLPIMRNLHAFDWVCKNGHRRYQGPSGPCTICGEPTTRDVVWIAKHSPQSKAYCFDPSPHFQYFREFNKRPEGKGDLTETMSIQGSFFMVSREKYFELNLCDENFGSWGSQGIEVACKIWLSGGRCVVTHKTYYAHMFRTSGGDFGFPYSLSGNSVERAKKTARDLFFNNNWHKQIRPLSWLIKKFWPVYGWTDCDLSRLLESEASISHLRPKLFGGLGIVSVVPGSVTDHTSPVPIDRGGEQMPISAMGLPSLPSSCSIPSKDVFSVGNESKMAGIATGLIVTHVVDNKDISSLPVGDIPDIPGIHQSVQLIGNLVDPDFPISVVQVSSPNPTACFHIESDSGENPITNVLSKSGNVHNTSVLHNKIISKGVLYYTDNRLDSEIMQKCQRQLKKCLSGRDAQLVSVSLEPIDFGENVVLQLERGYLTMFKQILAGLEKLDCDVVFFAEHDVLYHPSHFNFVPPERDRYYYNTNVWKLRMSDGHGLHYDCQQLSGLCADRKLLIEHYRRRIEIVERDGFTMSMGFEPGTHNRAERVDDYKAESWQSERPIIDLRHGSNLTKSKWKKEDFRNKQFTAGWIEQDNIPGWGHLWHFWKKI